MIYLSEIKTTYLINMWEAWIDVQEGLEPLYTFNVVGEIYWQEAKFKPALVRRPFQPENRSELQLEIRPGILWNEGVIREIRYSEQVPNLHRYNQVAIYLGDNLLIRLQNIEVVEDF